MIILRLQDKIITDKLFYREMFAIFLPVILQSCINQGVNMMDTLMVGTLGEAAISASSLANQFYTFYNLLCMGLSGAGLVLSAQYWGIGNRERVQRVMDLLIRLITVASFGFAIVTFAVPEQIMQLYIDDEAVIREGAVYLKITSLIYLPHGLSLMISNLMRSVGNAKLGLLSSSCSFFVNILTNYVLIFGKFGFPTLGLAGAAWGTLCARLVELIICAVFSLKIDTNLRYNLSGLAKRSEKTMLKEFVRIGLPIVIGDLLLAFSSNAVSWILGHMGKEYVSSYAIVQVIERMCTIAAGGAASAAGVMIGHAIGAKNYAKAKLAANTFLLAAVGIGITGAVLVLGVGELLISFYNIRPETAKIASSMMIANAIVIVFQVIQSVMGKGVLRGAGDTRFVMFTDVIFQWLVSIPLGYTVGISLGLAPFFVLISVRMDYIIKGIVYIFRSQSSKWLKTVETV